MMGPEDARIFVEMGGVHICIQHVTKIERATKRSADPVWGSYSRVWTADASEPVYVAMEPSDVVQHFMDVVARAQGVE